MTARLRQIPIRLRLATAYAFLLMVTVGAVGLYLLTTMESNLQQETDESLRLRAAHVEREITIGEAGILNREAVATALFDLAPLEEFSAPGIYVQVFDVQGTVLSSSPNLPGGRLPATSGLVTAALGGQEGFVTAKAGPDRVRIFALPLQHQGKAIGTVLVGESLHLLDVTLGRMRQLLAVAAIGAALVSIVVGWWLTSSGLGPIAAVTRVARRIAVTGQFEQRLEAPPAHDELGELVSTFNEMLDRLERSFRLQREFLADASHELRGPLTVIRGNLDLLKMDISEEDREESAREVTEELERMSRLISDLLFLAEVDVQEMVERQPVALDEVVSKVSSRAGGVDGGAHEIAVDNNEPATVGGDRYRLEQMLWNLVDNALRYTPPGGKVTLSLRSHGEIAEVTVADTGIGIPQDQLPRIFERFYRVDRARSRGHGGAGLGLAIVKQVAEAHGGQVRVRSSLGEGTVFTIALPVQT